MHFACRTISSLIPEWFPRSYWLVNGKSLLSVEANRRWQPTHKWLDGHGPGTMVHRWLPLYPAISNDHDQPAINNPHLIIDSQMTTNHQQRSLSTHINHYFSCLSWMTIREQLLTTLFLVIDQTLYIDHNDHWQSYNHNDSATTNHRSSQPSGNSFAQLPSTHRGQDGTSWASAKDWWAHSLHK